MLIPRQSLLSLRSRSFFLVLIKTLDHNMGQGSSHLIWSCILRESFSTPFNKGFSHKRSTAHIRKCWRCQSKANNGSSIIKQGSQYLSKKNDEKHIYKEKPAKSKKLKRRLRQKSRHPADCKFKIDSSGKS